MDMPLWGQILASFGAGMIVGIALFIVVTSDDPEKWWSAHQLGKRDNIAYLVLAIAFGLGLYGIVPIFGNIYRIDLFPYWLSIKSYLPYLTIGVIGSLISRVWIKKKKKKNEERKEEKDNEKA